MAPDTEEQERDEVGGRKTSSSGMLPVTRMIKAGAVFDIIGAVLCVIGVIAMANLVGLA